ncbi:hypothetical protein L0337_42730, partial [candidate division KSB1 bacterium]|nr:hypothetical protein [candidate division KSB1 bacterium]
AGQVRNHFVSDSSRAATGACVVENDTSMKAFSWTQGGCIVVATAKYKSPVNHISIPRWFDFFSFGKVE